MLKGISLSSKQRMPNKLLLAMKLTVVLLLTACLNVSAKGLSQTVTLNVHNIPLEKVCKQIRIQTGYHFIYDEEIADKMKSVSLTVEKADIKEVMQKLLNGYPFIYTINLKVITILEADNSASIVKPEFDQPITIIIHGRVVDENNKPVPGVTVTVKGTKKATSTDDNGEFTLRKVDDTATLVFTSANMETLEAKVDGKTELTVNLKTKVSSLRNVMVTYSSGYEDIPKDRATGSFVQIDNALLNRTVSTNILERINYVTSGLYYNPRNVGAPNGPILIRGISTINANQKPLIVMDGFAYDEGTIDGLVNNINPNDVESITVLKDAAAASIWGALAGNGVIVITTKKGKLSGKTAIQLNTNLTIGQKPDLFAVPTISSADEIGFEKARFATGYYNDFDDLYPGYDYFPAQPLVAELLLAVRKGRITQAEADAQIAALQQHDVRTDLKKYFYQASINQQYALNFSGGSPNYTYYGSLGYDNNRTNTVGSVSDRITARLDNTYRPLKNLEINGYIVYAQNKGSASVVDLPTNLAPYTPLADTRGNAIAIPYSYRTAYVDTASYPGLLDWHYRPLDELRKKYFSNTNEQFDTRLGAGLKYSFTPGLNGELKYQYEKSLTNGGNIGS